MNPPKRALVQFWGAFWEPCLIKYQVKNKAKIKCVWDDVFGGMLADLGMHFDFDFATVCAWEAEKRRSGKNVKMSTASKRDAHFRGLEGSNIGQAMP